MKLISRSTRLMIMLVILILSMLAVAPTQAAPPANNGRQHNTNQCLNRKLIPFWGSRSFIEAQGFNFDIIGEQASVKFSNNLSLDLASNPANSGYTASRMTEIDDQQPIADRVKCWEATPTRNVVVEYSVRFDQSAAQSGLTENLILWNAPLPSPGSGETAKPITAIGVTRNAAFGTPQYYAEVVQDLDFATFAPPFILNLTPMPTWLDAGQWHRVRITLSQTTGQVEVAQGAYPFTTVTKVTLLHPTGPLGFEFSMDNEFVPGVYVPITIPDGLDVSYLDIHTERVR
ncbi:MAG TPA: hypothetical protein VFU22_12700 [Roseiflexaceae bacterium]|nr:hypothetical protein [Roseiflexaceae bacterium]